MSGGWQHWQGGQLPGSPAGGGPPSPCCVPTPRCYLEPQAFLPMPPHGPPPPGSAPSSPRQAPRGLAWGRGRGQAPAREAAGTERPAGAGSERGCFGPRLGAGRHGALTASGLRAEGAARPSTVQVSSPPHCYPPLEVPWGPPRLRRGAPPRPCPRRDHVGWLVLGPAAGTSTQRARLTVISSQGTRLLPACVRLGACEPREKERRVESVLGHR